MSRVLEELWYGNIEPDKMSEEEVRHLKKLNDMLAVCEKKLIKTLDDDAKTFFEEYKNCYEEIVIINEKERFINGFILGARIMMECLEKDRF